MNVYFTVDTESSMGGAWRHPDRRPLESERLVFCRIADRDYGIPLQVRMLKEFGFRGTYFVETLATRCLGASNTKAIFDYLLREGQDVQLHAHPVFYFYSQRQTARAQGRDCQFPQQPDEIGRFEESLQMTVLAEANEYFIKFAGYRPTAFRAGCFAGSRSTLKCLHKLGITVDSSFNPCYHPDMSFPDITLLPNLVQQIEGVWEIPITVARCRLPEGYKGYKYADCSSISFAEIQQMLEAGVSSGLKHFVIVFHSFSAVKPRDETFAVMRPDRIVIRRLEKMLRYLAENTDKFRVQTMGAAADRLEPTQACSSEAIVTNLGLAKSAVRKAVQLFNRPYWV